MDDLEERVQKFITLSLPGQPVIMHMGTARLVSDLWREVQRLRKIDAAQQSVQRTCAKSPDGEHHFEPGESLIICEYCGASR